MNNKNAYYILTVIVIAAGGIPKGMLHSRTHIYL